MTIRGVDDIREAYRDTGVAERYIEERFVQPLGAMQHSRQLRYVQRAIDRHQPARVLEIAPGPARLTAEVSLTTAHGVLVDASAQMLAQARRRLVAADQRRWSPLQADGFRLPFQRAFDLVYTFRFIRHFEGSDRQRLYRGIAEILRPGGLLIFDAVNETVSAPLRAAAPEAFRHYDALLRPEALRAELNDAGFDLVNMRGLLHRYTWLYQVQVLVSPRSRLLARLAMEIADRTGGEPLEWVVTCRRR